MGKGIKVPNSEHFTGFCSDVIYIAFPFKILSDSLLPMTPVDHHGGVINFE